MVCVSRFQPWPSCCAVTYKTHRHVADNSLHPSNQVPFNYSRTTSYQRMVQNTACRPDEREWWCCKPTRKARPRSCSTSLRICADMPTRKACRPWACLSRKRLAHSLAYTIPCSPGGMRHARSESSRNIATCAPPHERMFASKGHFAEALLYPGIPVAFCGMPSS